MKTAPNSTLGKLQPHEFHCEAVIIAVDTVLLSLILESLQF